MTRNVHRDSADAQRAAAKETNLPNVRERHLRSAEAHDAIAGMEEKTVAGNKERAEINAAKRAAADE